MNKLLFIVAVCTIISCRNKKQNTILKKAGWAVFENEDYSINYPEEWELNPSKQFGAAFMVFSPI